MPLHVLITFIALLVPVLVLLGLAFLHSKMFSKYSLTPEITEEIRSERDNRPEILMVLATPLAMFPMFTIIMAPLLTINLQEHYSYSDPSICLTILQTAIILVASLLAGNVLASIVATRRVLKRVTNLDNNTQPLADSENPMCEKAITSYDWLNDLHNSSTINSSKD